MAGITDLPFRIICKNYGVGLVCTEMASAKAIYYGDEKTKQLLDIKGEKRPISAQIFGSDVESMKVATEYVNTFADILDINMGCPVPKVAVRAQAGSALLKDPDKVYEIVKAVKEAVPCPVTVKIRSGWDENSINAVEIAKVIEKAGADAIAVHPRTRAQGYSGKANWNIIKEVKENDNIPVIGNGDILTCYDAKRMLDETGCDAIMIGRGVLGNPWLIKECIEYLEDKKEPKEVSVEEKINMIKYHIELLRKTKCDKLALLEIRSHASWYLKGIKNSSKLRTDICKAKNIEELLNLIEEFLREKKYES